ncbi:DUF5712 family protein [Hymenobacter defluvii]|uniref:Mobilization protein n=1 Tax=Hymenobacter defluvii TaxID=2054411 RepID=A0ABS3TF52_9BACT|nr:DUF5712 family protein [Hymenobacter defluvii]MBO3272282.1 hypothetical protein [Hymenobacter defluvii]
MYCKIIDPRTHGKQAYQNTGSVVRTVNYLVKEAKKDGREPQFFTVTQDGVGADEIKQAIDRNSKGLRKEQAKFYSLVISPNARELDVIGNDPEKLKAYTRARMEHYAQNFALPAGKRLQSVDLVWGAILHQERTYRGTDQAVIAGSAKVGERREGLQTHVHILVSARDATRKITLNPQGPKKRFDMIEWQNSGPAHFAQQFGPPDLAGQLRTFGFPTVNELRNGVKEAIARAQQRRQRERAESSAGEQRRSQHIADRVGEMNQRLAPEQRLETDRIVQIGQQRGYDKTFYSRLARLEQRVEAGVPVDNAYFLLRTGRERETTSTIGRGMGALLRQIVQNERDINRYRTQDIGERHNRDKGEIDMY